MNAKAFVTLVSLAVLATTFCAASAADHAFASITVKYADLDPGSPSGARVLYRRIRAAAKSACDYFRFNTDAEESLCVQNTIAKAVSEVNRPALTAVYNAKYPFSTSPRLVSEGR